LTGCSGCEHGTQGLCSWIDISVLHTDIHAFTCVPTDVALDLVELGEYTAANRFFSNASTHCPKNARDAPIIRDNVADSNNGYVDIRTVSVIHNTFHEMEYGVVPYRPWPVDRTSLYGRLGAIRLSAYFNLVSSQLGLDAGGNSDCATVNSKELLIDSGLIHNYLQGALITPRDVFCVRAMLGSLISTHCPEYGKASSGISWSLYLNLATNCGPFNELTAGDEAPNVFPQLYDLGGIFIPKTIFGYLTVPDGTPFAIDSVQIWPSEILEEEFEIDEINYDLENEDPVYVFGS